MSEIDTGGVVYPVVLHQDVGDTLVTHGITRRDWLAGLAMQGIASNLDSAGSIDEIASVAYDLADALILEGRKEGGE